MIYYTKILLKILRLLKLVIMIYYIKKIKYAITHVFNYLAWTIFLIII